MMLFCFFDKFDENFMEQALPVIAYVSRRSFLSVIPFEAARSSL